MRENYKRSPAYKGSCAIIGADRKRSCGAAAPAETLPHEVMVLIVS